MNVRERLIAKIKMGQISSILLYVKIQKDLILWFEIKEIKKIKIKREESPKLFVWIKKEPKNLFSKWLKTTKERPSGRLHEIEKKKR